MRVSRVMPARMVSDSGGVSRVLSAMTKKAFIAEFLDPAPLDGVQEHHLIAALLPGLGLGGESRCVIAAALGCTGSAGRSPDIVIRYPHRHGRSACLEIAGHRRGQNGVPEMVARPDA